MKKLLLNIAWIMTVLFTLASCTKIGKNITVKGRVLNPITGVGISGVEIKLLRSQNLQYNGGYKAIKKVISDENGNYEINATRLGPIYLIPGEIGQNYSLGFNYEGQYYSMLKVDKGKEMHVDYHLVPYGEIKISLHNINCSGANDTLIYKRGYISFPNINVFQPFILTGCYTNEGAFAQVPSGDYNIQWTVIRNGVVNNYSHILTIPGNGQAYYNIDY